jgi:hypothetical protein
MIALSILQDCCTVNLTQGQNTLLDVEDYAELSQLKWCALWNRCTSSFYAVRTINHRREPGKPKGSTRASLRCHPGAGRSL